MATATRETVTLTQPIEVEVVNLQITLEEAQALRQVLGSVGGPPSTTRRGLTDRIMHALQDAGVKSRDIHDSTFDLAGSVTFLTEENQGTYTDVNRKYGNSTYIAQRS